MGRAIHFLALSAVIAAGGPLPSPATAQTPTEQTAEGTLADGAAWRATVPANWNGTLLVYGHGYSFNKPAAEDAPGKLRAALLAEGYAIAGSTYGGPGWALDTAPRDQFDAIAAFSAKFGKPKRVIAWGMSMGALVTTAMVEKPGGGIDGGVAFCGSIGGSIGMMNVALDGAYAFRTLVAPDADIRLVNVDDDRINAGRVGTALAAAQATPHGRARIALAAVLAGIPGWTTGARPADADFDEQEAQMAKAFAMGVFLPRTDQEKRAGGNFSWNTGIDYKRQLQLSGRIEMVRALYKAAELDLDADLAALNAGTRIAANPAAVKWMTANYAPNARPVVPLLAVQNIGDGMTSPSLQRAYADSVAVRGGGALVRSLYVSQPGHCTFDTATVVDSIKLLDARIATRRWPRPPARFVAYTPSPMLRPCVRGGAPCK